MSKRFAIMGVGGFVAPRHLRAIHELGHQVVAAIDLHDSVGIIDQFFPDCHFFTQFERFERFLAKESREGRPIEYLSVCTPNYLHDSHCRFGLRMGMNVICEKPLVLNPWNVDALIEAEELHKKWIANILQLRLHPDLKKLKREVDQSREHYHVNLDYHTPRGRWYDISWKGDLTKSGGIVTNIGVHLFDLLLWIFGPVVDIGETTMEERRANGFLQLKKASIQWNLNTFIDANTRSTNPRRVIQVNDREITFDKGFSDLHTHMYQEILNGRFVSCKELIPLIQLMWDLRQRGQSH